MSYNSSFSPQHRIRWIAKDCNSIDIYKPNEYFAIFVQLSVVVFKLCLMDAVVAFACCFL
jgi:hypothetical protein